MVQIKAMHVSLRPVQIWSQNVLVNDAIQVSIVVCEIVLQLFLVYFIANFKDDLA